MHPAILSKGGLGPAMRTLARRSAVPVELHVAVDQRLPETVEVAAYYVVAEALTNAAKHAHASEVRVSCEADTETLSLKIYDDGIGGADVSRGSGLIGLRDRVEAVGGRLEIASIAGYGTCPFGHHSLRTCLMCACGRPHDDLVDVHLGRLPDRERDGIGDRRRGNGKCPVLAHRVAGLRI